MNEARQKGGKAVDGDIAESLGLPRFRPVLHTLHLASLLQIGQHHHHAAPLLHRHPPKVIHCCFHGPCGWMSRVGVSEVSLLWCYCSAVGVFAVRCKVGVSEVSLLWCFCGAVEMFDVGCKRGNLAKGNKND
ncbi:hypothetical protein E2C01_003391 [Portunus trituberculatus]|uniref:Uncharacterized protein n=1 Tax=Portunus trituberculatus TaxID=210409 RepID=A0A5B7CPN1_PORTR|nr:hypothetical protein [Portunus trituberculatus]